MINPDTKILREWLGSMPRRDYNKIQLLLVEECLAPLTTIRNWIYGTCRSIPMHAKRDINRVARELSGHDIFVIVPPGGASVGVSGALRGGTVTDFSPVNNEARP